MNNTYVYLHKRLTDDVVFYVGIGKVGRAWSTARRNPHWVNVVAKHGYTVNILQQNLSWEEACEIEISLIAHYRLLNGSKLTNICAGGEGAVYPKSEATKEKLRIANLGKKQSAETIAKRVASQSKAPRTAEWRANISKGQKGKIIPPESIAKMVVAQNAMSDETKAIKLAKFQTTLAAKSEEDKAISTAKRVATRNAKSEADKAISSAKTSATWAAKTEEAKAIALAKLRATMSEKSEEAKAISIAKRIATMAEKRRVRDLSSSLI